MAERKARTPGRSGEPSPGSGRLGRDERTGRFGMVADHVPLTTRHRQIAKGIPASIVADLSREGLTRADIHLVIPERTLARRLSHGGALTVEEADALTRLRRVVAAARRVFGRAELADEWLRLPNPELDGEVPIRMARTDLGGREVEAVLGRLEHGVHG